MLQSNASTKGLEENQGKDGVITLPSGLQYRVIEEGAGDKHPKVGTECECHYTGRLLDGTEFDSSYKRGGPSTFAPDQAIKGWTEALQLMVVGDKFVPQPAVTVTASTKAEADRREAEAEAEALYVGMKALLGRCNASTADARRALERMDQVHAFAEHATAMAALRAEVAEHAEKVAALEAAAAAQAAQAAQAGELAARDAAAGK